jgi:hypothetical protein
MHTANHPRVPGTTTASIHRFDPLFDSTLRAAAGVRAYWFHRGPRALVTRRWMDSPGMTPGSFLAGQHSHRQQGRRTGDSGSP